MLFFFKQNTAYEMRISDWSSDVCSSDLFEFCHYRAHRGMRVDGYCFDDEGGLDLFVADFECRSELASLTRTDVDAAFKRLTAFFEASLNKGLARELEVTSPEYGLARQIADRKGQLQIGRASGRESGCQYV